MLRARETRAICSAALAGLICGSSPLPERVTASMGTVVCGGKPLRLRYSSANCCTPAKDSSVPEVVGSSGAPSLSFGLAGPRFVPPEEAASYPAPAAEGRGWKYSGPAKFCPISSEPMMTSSRAYQTAVGLAREQRPCENEKRHRKDHPGQEGEQEDAQQGRPKLLAQGYDERRCR